jgi:RimJ/RimL family protein N-acetyltransferase
MRFEPVHAGTLRHVMALYSLLQERKVEINISHKKMPTYEEHVEFVKSDPYKAWYICTMADEVVGSVYLTHQNEIGIFVFNRYQGIGYGRLMIEQLRQLHDGPFYANVSPKNAASQGFFTHLGAKQIQVTYELSENYKAPRNSGYADEKDVPGFTKRGSLP